MSDPRSGLMRPKVLGWLFAPVARHPEIRDELIGTVVQRRPAVFISCAAVMIMSISAAILTGSAWALGWFAADFALISYRLYLSFRYDDGSAEPIRGRAEVVASMFTLFIVFGLGCSICIISGPAALMLMALISVLGVFAGVASRWAAFPRLALVTITAIAIPVCLAVTVRAGGGLGMAAVQFAAVAAMTISQTVQNHRTLLRMLVAEHRNALLARTDALTGLGNRIRLREDLKALLSDRSATECRREALLYLDLDGFKAFNDTRGHDAGDELLKKVGETISTMAKDGRAYRLGGDEFVVVSPLCDQLSAVQLAQHIVGGVASTRLGGSCAGVGVSVGIALVSENDSPEALLIRADEALYAAKRAGKSCYHVADAPSFHRPLAA
ncbi:diguanylate cyclase [Sphingomonas sp. NBWT7]|uniref:GGDEF domain-containing protein n=1 Tax=Sphingomonas sp. NBWT7 TaxID=2596913 RepID=UPI001628DAFB|nr:diguanylate cyclase [Sphingomonas sp. NBWT7]QNE32493.1 diguanylate cyclase [Sphingomonas sp. NBWT7]